jgi:hypothetical protein
MYCQIRDGEDDSTITNHPLCMPDGDIIHGDGINLD